ncbi:MAG: MFS transporter [Deltaproteobacteria bacterium]|nr:MFS transporter [Deltaproteobacteria bacterium]
MRLKGVPYTYYVVFACFLILFFNSGARYAFGVILKPIGSDFGLGRGSVSSVFLVNMIVFALSLPFTGKLYDRLGARPIIISATILLALGLFLTAKATSYLALFFSYGVIAALGISGTSIPLISAIVSKWVSKSEGMIVSLSLSGHSLGHFFLVPLIGILTERYGWRGAYTIFAAIILFVNLSLSLLVFKKPKEERLKRVKEAQILSSNNDIDLAFALKTPSMWFFAFMMFVCGGGDYFVVTHLVAMATDFGISQIEATNMLGLYGFMSLLGILVAGPFADRYGCKIPILFTFLLRVLLFYGISIFKSTFSFYVFSLIFGLTHLVTAPLTPYLAGKMYGKSHLGSIVGFINTVHFLGGGLFGYLGGSLFDMTSSYDVSFYILGSLSLLASLSTLPIKEKRHSLQEVSASSKDLA